MKLNKVSAGIISCLIALLAATATAADFRGNSWGDSPDQVRAVEGPAELEYTMFGLPALSYAVTLGACADAWASFYFTATGELAVGKYFAPETGIAVFNAWAEALTGKYGPPQNADAFHTSSEYLLSKYYYDTAGHDLECGVELGYFTLCDFWELGATRIYLKLKPFKGRTHATIDYVSKEYGPKLLKEQAEGGQAGF